MISVIAEPFERKLKRKKRILELEEKIVVAKRKNDTAKVALYESENVPPVHLLTNAVFPQKAFPITIIFISAPNEL